MSNKITKDEFEDVLYNPKLTIVEKSKEGRGFHYTWVYVYEGKKVVRMLQRLITSSGTEFTEEIV